MVVERQQAKSQQEVSWSTLRGEEERSGKQRKSCVFLASEVYLDCDKIGVKGA